MHNIVYVHVLKYIHSMYAANADMSMELFEMLRRKVQEMRDQLPSPGEVTEVTDIKPTPAQCMLPLILPSQVIEANAYVCIYSCYHDDPIPCTC